MDDRDGTGSTTTADDADAEPWLAPWVHRGSGNGDGSADVGGGDFEAAKAAAREAEDNYSRAGNAAGALVARRTEMSLRGDEAMGSIAPLLRKRYANLTKHGCLALTVSLLRIGKKHCFR